MARDFFNTDIFYRTSKVENEKEKGEEENITPKHLRLYGDKVVDLFCKKFAAEGLAEIKKDKEENKYKKFIITAAHLNNLDVPAALKVFGPEFNIQITGESVLLEKMKYLGHRMMINLAGRENFTPLSYKEDKEGKHGSFDPENFTELEEKMEEGKTPWIAAHPFSLNGKMKKVSLGPVYLAAKTKAELIPTALDISGGSVTLEGVAESAKTLVNRSEAIYRIGKPFAVADIDVSIIDLVLEKRKRGETIEREELAEFNIIHKQLREQADLLGEQLELLLPSEKRIE